MNEENDLVREPQLDREAVIERWESSSWDPGDLLPHHLPGCYGCGERNDQGLGLQGYATEDPEAVRASYTFDQRFQGAIGLLHGGLVAAALDELFGFLAMRIQVPAVTRELTVRYLHAVKLGSVCELTARVAERDRRTLRFQGEIRQGGRSVAEAEALFVQVETTRLLGEGV